MRVALLSASIVALAAGSAASMAAVQPEARLEPPPAFTKVCVRCHASDKVVEGRRYPAQWEQVLEQMVARGAVGTDEELDIVYDYLVTAYGRVEINKATADEIAQVLHLEPDIAATVVKQRPFADFDALTAVPGVPVDELKKRRDAIVF
jgi:DNA uptake protein ComE-like DNA-binding protein